MQRMAAAVQGRLASARLAHQRQVARQRAAGAPREPPCPAQDLLRLADGRPAAKRGPRQPEQAHSAALQREVFRALRQQVPATTPSADAAEQERRGAVHQGPSLPERERPAAAVLRADLELELALATRVALAAPQQPERERAPQVRQQPARAQWAWRRRPGPKLAVPSLGPLERRALLPAPVQAQASRSG